MGFPNPYYKSGGVGGGSIGGTLGATTNVIPKASGVGGVTLQASGITENGTTVALGVLDLVTSGKIQGGMVATEVFKTASADSPLTAGQAFGTFVSNFGMTDADCVISLPTAAPGMSFMAVLPTVRARTYRFRAAATDKIFLNGIAGANNGYVGVASGYVTADSCSFFTFKAADGGYDWFAAPINGLWVAT